MTDPKETHVLTLTTTDQINIFVTSICESARKLLTGEGLGNNIDRNAESLGLHLKMIHKYFSSSEIQLPANVTTIYIAKPLTEKTSIASIGVGETSSNGVTLELAQIEALIGYHAQYRRVFKLQDYIYRELVMSPAEATLRLQNLRTDTEGNKDREDPFVITTLSEIARSEFPLDANENLLRKFIDSQTSSPLVDPPKLFDYFGEDYKATERGN